MGRKVVDKTGYKFITYQGYNAEVVECFRNSNCTVLFYDDTNTTIFNVQFSHIKKRILKNPNHPVFYGVGFIGQGKHTTGTNGDCYKNCKCWIGMLERCYSDKYQLKKPTYIDCSVDERWHNFQVFAEWFENNYTQGFELDKDILVKGNKVYSPETCCFVPREVNSLFTKRNSKRGDYPIGVRREGNRYVARLGGNIYLGIFDTIEEAFNAYKTAKELYIKEVADKWRSQITEQVYEAMYNYKVEITVGIKANSEQEAKEKAINEFVKNRDKMFNSKVDLQDDTYKVYGICDMDETWNMLND